VLELLIAKKSPEAKKCHNFLKNIHKSAIKGLREYYERQRPPVLPSD